MSLSFKTRIILALTGLPALCATLFLLCTGERNNPFDTQNPDYVSPSITIDTTGASLTSGDTISVDSATITVTGNRTESVFRASLDSAAWTQWESSGKFQFTTLTPGSHTVMIESKYNGWDDVASDKIVFFVRAKALDTTKTLTSFGFATPAATGTIDEATRTVSINVPPGTDLTALVATFATTGVMVKVDSATQVSGTSANNFTAPVTYIIVASDSSKREYVVMVTTASTTAKELTLFSFTNPAATGTINEAAKTIAVNVPYGTNVTTLVASFTTTGASVNVGSVAQVSGTTPNNFTTPVTYTVTAADNSTQDYIVTVFVSTDTAKALTSFGFTSTAATSTIDEDAKTVLINVPGGTKVTALIATFATTGKTVKVGSVAQISGTTPNNFTNPVTYTVTAADSSTQDYVVTVTASTDTAKALTSFGFTSPAAAGTINEAARTVAIIVPHGTDVSSLIATFKTTGSSVKVGSIPQISGTTPNNFTTPVNYTVTAGDNSTQVYTVTVNVSPDTSKSITSFSFTKQAATGTINEAAKTITVSVPYGTDVTALVATFSTTGTSVKVGAIPQVSGTTSQNYTSPITYTVTAADNSTKEYVVTVSMATSSAKALTTLNFTNPAATGTINETAKTIAVTVPYGTNVTALIATFATTGATVKIGSAVQVSGTTPNNFTSAVIYTVTADDKSMQNYTVTVTVAASPAKVLTSFSIVNPTATGTINEATKTVAINVPYGTTTAALVASFAITGASVKVGSTIQTSGTTPNNFGNPVTYTVTAADSSTQNYVVTVNVAANPAKALTSFGFTSPAAAGTIDEAAKTVAVKVPFGTDVTALAAVFVTSGASVKVATAVQVSGTTPNNFTAPVTYTITAADSSTQDYVVTVTAAASPAKVLTSFGFSSPAATGVVDEAAKTVTVNVSYTTNVTALAAVFSTTGASVKVGTTVQASGTTTNNFTTPVTYIVTAADGSTQEYIVTVTVVTSSTKALTLFGFVNPSATGTINNANKTIGITVPFGTDVTSLIATFVATGASVEIGTTVQASSTTPNNFSNPITYTVIAEDGSTQNYVVTVTVNPPSTVTLTAIQGVTAPLTGATPVTTITQTAQYTGTVSWSGSPVTFAGGTAYTATITMTAKSGFTFSGVAANFFTVTGATPTNSANTGIVTAIFPATAPIPVSFVGLAANGTSTTVTTTVLTLTFDTDPTTLTIDSIFVTGATKGTLTGTGLTRTLTISNITAVNGDTVSVSVASPAGFAITPASKAVTVYHYSLGLTMVSVPAGTFQRDATPANTSTISAFRMSAYEITRAQFVAIMGTDPSNVTYSSGTSGPVQMTNSYHAIAFCNKLSIAEGLTPVYSVVGVDFATLTYANIPTADNSAWNAASATRTNSGYRLPTEMEWMWAAMGASAGGANVTTTGYSKPFAGSNGSNAIGNFAVFGYAHSETGRTPTERSNPVGSKAANELGLYDMSGNIQEWCWDFWYESYPTGAVTDYCRTTASIGRVLRGGNWSDEALYSGVAERVYSYPYYIYYTFGFRVVRP